MSELKRGKGRPAHYPKRVTATFSLDERTRRLLRTISFSTERSMGELVDDAVNSYFMAERQGMGVLGATGHLLGTASAVTFPESCAVLEVAATCRHGVPTGMPDCNEPPAWSLRQRVKTMCRWVIGDHAGRFKR